MSSLPKVSYSTQVHVDHTKHHDASEVIIQLHGAFDLMVEKGYSSINLKVREEGQYTVFTFSGTKILTKEEVDERILLGAELKKAIAQVEEISNKINNLPVIVEAVEEIPPAEKPTYKKEKKEYIPKDSWENIPF